MTGREYFIEGAKDQQQCNPKLHTGCYMLPKKATQPFSNQDFLDAVQMMALPSFFIAVLIWHARRKR